MAGIHSEKQRYLIFPFKCGIKPMPFRGMPAISTERSGIYMQTAITALKTVLFPLFANTLAMICMIHPSAKAAVR